MALQKRCLLPNDGETETRKKAILFTSVSQSKSFCPSLSSAVGRYGDFMVADSFIAAFQCCHTGAGHLHDSMQGHILNEAVDAVGRAGQLRCDGAVADILHARAVFGNGAQRCV